MITKMEIWNSLTELSKTVEEISLKEALQQQDQFRNRAIKKAIELKESNHEVQHILYGIKLYDAELDIVKTVVWFYPTTLTDEEIIELSKLENAEFFILHCGNHSAETLRECLKRLTERNKLKIAPITLKEANDFVKDNHRHHPPVTGCRFAISCEKDKKRVGVVICGRPVSRVLDDGKTLEVNRLATDGTKDVCSKLYAAAVKTAAGMGYKKVITYILASETGTSLKAAGFTLEDADCGGTKWTGKRSKCAASVPAEKKQRWAMYL